VETLENTARKEERVQPHWELHILGNELGILIIFKIYTETYLLIMIASSHAFTIQSSSEFLNQTPSLLRNRHVASLAGGKVAKNIQTLPGFETFRLFR
jgi:hypothetical protein